jgi:glycerate kinase
MFAPQKGASPAQVDALEGGLARLVEVIDSDLGADVSTIPGTGAGGGMGIGLVAFFGAALRPGAESVAQAIGLADAIKRADLVVTGEGRLDVSSLAGKTTAYVADLARSSSVPCLAIVGEMQVGVKAARDAGFTAVAELPPGSSERSHLEVAIAHATSDLLTAHHRG